MATVTYLHIHGEEADLVLSEDSVIFDSDSFRAQDLNSFGIPDFLPSDHSFHDQIAVEALDSNDCECFNIHRGLGSVLDPGSIPTSDPFNRDNQVSFVMDLFQQRVEESRRVTIEGDSSSETINDSVFERFEESVPTDSDNFEVDLESVLGVGADISELENDISCPPLSDRGDEFLVHSRVSDYEPEYAESSSSTQRDPEVFDSGLRICGFGSDEDETESVVLDVELLSELDGSRGDVDTNLCLRWDSLGLEDHGTEDFEWEEVDGRVEEREVASVVIEGEEDEASVSMSPALASQEELRLDAMVESRVANLEWQVLLTPDSLERNYDLEDEVGGDLDDFIRTADYEMLFGQFAENENPLTARPPASLAVVQNLPSAIILQEDVEENNAVCAVCRDEVNVGEKTKWLPCSHWYHRDCILQWLGIRNTCPVCRYELPTDDLEYERSRVQRAGLHP